MSRSSEMRQPVAEDAGGVPAAAAHVSSGAAASGVTTRFGKFQLLATLGTGGMGEVFLALASGALGVEKLVVVKRMRHLDEDDDVMREARDMFLNEGRLASRLNHPNVVQTNEVGVENGHYYLTMEYLEGQSVNKMIAQAQKLGHSIPAMLAARIVSDALAGLHYAHELKDYDGTPLNIVHRDMSPHNVFVTYDGVVKILDFGIAKAELSGVKKTEHGVVKGKFAYMAPEQAAQEDIDRRADIFVTGIVLWELLTGTRLMSRKNDFTTIFRLLNEPIARVSTIAPDVPKALDDIVAKALERDPSLRYPTAQAMRDALEEFLATQAPPVRQEDVGRFVNTLFKDEREWIKQRIQQCIAGARSGMSVDALPSLNQRQADASGSGPHAMRSGGHDHIPVTVTGSVVHASMSTALSPQHTAHPKGKSTGIRVAIAAAAIAAGLFGLRAFFASPSKNAQATEPPSPVVTAPSSTASAGSAQATASTLAAAAPHPSTEVTAAPAQTSRAASPVGIRRGGSGARAPSPPPASGPATATAAPAASPPPAPAAPTATSRGRVFNTEL